MCNLYSMRKSRDELVKLFGVSRVGNDVQFDFPGIYPDAMAPVVRQEDGGLRTFTMMRWGFPPPPNLGTRPVTNVRNTKSAYWRGWLNQAKYRCLVPATSFCENFAELSVLSGRIRLANLFRKGQLFSAMRPRKLWFFQKHWILLS